MHILDLATKDLKQIVRDWRTALFLLIMPIAFTWLFGIAFGGTSGSTSDPRLPVGYLDQDNGSLSPYILRLMETWKVIRLESGENAAALEKKVADKDYVAAVIIPSGYTEQALAGEPVKATVILDLSSTSGRTVQDEIQAGLNHLFEAVRAARITTQAVEDRRPFDDAAARQAFFETSLQKAIQAWDNPPIIITSAETGGQAGEKQAPANAYAHSSPGMMAQFAIAGLMGAATILVVERKSRSLQRLLTTAISRPEILAGHFLAMFVMIFVQIMLLVLCGQLFFQLNYLRVPLGALLMIITSALFAAGLGLLIGTLAQTEQQVIIFSLIPMFLLAGLGGAWVPLEFTSPAVQVIGHFTPVAWMMDGFEGILVRGAGLQEVLLPAGVLAGFALLLIGLSVWRFKFE